MAAQMNNSNLDDQDNESDDTFSDISEEATIKNNRNNKENEKIQDGSDDFDFSEKPKRLKLKPSKIQQNAEKTAKCDVIEINETDLNANDDDEDDKIAIQTEVLSDYLKPTNILSKYQNGPSSNKDDEDNEEEEEEEEEEKEWPTTKEELEFNDVTDAFNLNKQQYDNQSDEEFMNEEEKSHFDQIEYDDLLPYLMEEANKEININDIIIEDFQNIGWFDYMKIFFFGGCAISLSSNKLNMERDIMFKIAKLKLDLTNFTHNRMLQTLWMRLTNDTRQCDKTGSHWEQIGFQGNDPSTDIRGSGLLGILQIIYMIENYNDIIYKIYLLSINDHQHFPFMIVSFNITGIVIQLLRSCLIYNYINKNKSVSHSINEIYVALFYQFYLNWKIKSRTIINFDSAQKELEKDTFSNWNGLINQLIKRGDEIKEQRNTQKQKLIASDSEDDQDIEFGISSNKNYKNSDKSNTKRQNRYQM